MFKRPGLLSTAFLAVLPLAAIALITSGGAPPTPQAQAFDAPEPQPLDHTITLLVTTTMQRSHLLQRELDDEMSRRIMALFLKGLDPSKAYFLKSDIDEFMSQRDELDDLLKKRDVSFGFTVFNRYMKRVEERVALVEELLKNPPDITLDEEFPVNPETSEYSADEDAARDFWRRRVKYEWLLLKQEGDKTDDEIRTAIVNRFHRYQKQMEDTSHDELLERFLTASTMAYDPHTSYMSPSTLEEFYIRMRLNYQGIGAELSPGDDGYATIHRILPGGAAEKAGELQAKDRIVSVGQDEDGEMVDVVNKRLRDIIDLIRGPEGTVVRLGVLPAGETEMKVYSITRDRIELQDAAAAGEVMEVGAKPDGKPYRVGVVDLPSFYADMEAAQRDEANYRSTTRDVAAILDEFKKQEVDSVVLDLRRNGGGSLSEAISLTGLFIDRGPVVQVKGPTRGRATPGVMRHMDRDAGMAWAGPLVVLTSKFSASASEILAGAVQDYHRGVIVGDHSTHGKGTVQTLLELGPNLIGRRDDAPNFGALKITISQFYRPNGDSTQNRGVVSDIVLPSITDVIAKGEKELDYAIAFDSIDPAEFQLSDMVDAELKNELAARSQARIVESKDFHKVEQRVKRFEDQQSRKTVPLNEEKFKKYRGDDESEEAVEEEVATELEEARQGNKIQRDYYLDEVLQIAADYAGLTKKE